MIRRFVIVLGTVLLATLSILLIASYAAPDMRTQTFNAGSKNQLRLKAHLRTGTLALEWESGVPYRLGAAFPGAKAVNKRPMVRDIIDPYGRRVTALEYGSQLRTIDGKVVGSVDVFNEDFFKQWNWWGFLLINSGTKTSNQWHLAVPIWKLLSPGILLFTVMLYFRPFRSLKRRRKGQCVSCGYDLTSNESGVCPECGRPFAKAKYEISNTHEQTVKT